MVVAERAHHRNVYRGIYTGGDTLAAGKVVVFGEIPAGSALEQAKVFIDYVRLADGTAWGDAETEQAKEITTRFQK